MQVFLSRNLWNYRFQAGTNDYLLCGEFLFSNLNGMLINDDSLSMSYINKRSLSELSIGDIVVTSGENGNYMRDVPVGTIAEIKVLDYDSSLDIELNPILDFSKLETVLIVDPDRKNDRVPFTEEAEHD